MGFGNFGITELLILLLIVALIFGTRHLRSLGGDLGASVRSFRKGLKGEQDDPDGDKGEGPGDSSN